MSLDEQSNGVKKFLKEHSYLEFHLVDNSDFEFNELNFSKFELDFY